MILTWMLAATLFALLAGAAARAAESAARLLRWQGRAPWLLALGVSIAWPVAAPLVATRGAVRLSPVVVDDGAVRSVAARLPALPASIASHLDDVLLALWVVASLLLAARLLRAQRAIVHISRSARPSEIDGHAVLLTDGIGPAVVGIAAPRVAVPAWLNDLDRPLRDLVLRHEREHCRSRDTVLLWLGELAIALMPWNPAIWWQTRRLRLALEIDCDARTVRDPAAVASYGRLLLLIAQRQQLTRLAPMLAESSSHLSRRISAMTCTSPSHKLVRIAVLGAVAVGAIVAACSSRVGNDLVGPVPNGGKRVAVQANAQTIGAPAGAGVFFEYQVENPVMYAPGSPAPKYPDILKTAGVGGEVIVSYVVDTMGLADPSTLKVIKSTHQLFVNAVVAALPDMRFVPATKDGHKVKQLVMEPFVFNISASDSAKAAMKRSGAAVLKPE